MGPIVVKHGRPRALRSVNTCSDFFPGISQGKKEWEKCEAFILKKMEHEKMFWVRWRRIDKYTLIQSE